MSLVRKNKEYAEIDILREHKQKLKNVEAERVWRNGRIEEFKAYLAMQGLQVDSFDRDLFRRLN